MSEIKGSHLLVATGRNPRVDTLGLDQAGVTVDEGGIVVDAKLRTNVQGVYAIGDVVAKARTSPTSPPTTPASRPRTPCCCRTPRPTTRRCRGSPTATFLVDELLNVCCAGLPKHATDPYV